MAKGQQRSNREIRKPKAPKPPSAVAATGKGKPPASVIPAKARLKPKKPA